MPDSDVLVIGAGAAGSVLAARLAASGLAVTLLEAGPAKRGLVNRVPALAFMASIDPATNWDFTTEPVPGLDDRPQRWSQGRMLGGSSGINGMLWMRGGRADYDAWQAAGCPGWGWDDVLQVYRDIECSDRGGDPLHGADGPLRIRRARLDLPLTGRFLGAMRGADLPVVDDVNGDLAEGFGLFDVNIHGGERHGVARAWLDPARRLPNLHILTEATVTRLLVEEGRVTGAEVRRGGETLTLRAGGGVALCCGAIKTPQLLMLSGIGPAEVLRAHGIPVLLDCPGVGQNLHNHPAVALRYALGEPLSAFRHLSPLRAMAAGLRYALGRGGPLGESYVAMGGLFRSDPGLAASDLMAVVMPALVRRAEVGARLREIFEYRHGFAVSVSLARQASRGAVTLRSADPLQAPRIAPGYFSDPADMRAMVAGLLRLRAALAASDLAPALTEIAPLAGAETRDALADAVRAACGTFYHPGGTCRMGSDAAAPVDPQLRLRGIGGLRIADASVVPLPMGATMHAPSILVGERAARFMTADLRAPQSTQGRFP
ncbi:GMC family oxidoreductase [Gemmobacter sp.]|uniref:GMC family oxidoreductase n=1 Tax=Gemmobacter sp. TaxID=1898957 RepID=UPI002AFE4382|nr:GMC family oxidoreductase N-terminal domain-containing protein [Gemmobacter sp.]